MKASSIPGRGANAQLGAFLALAALAAALPLASCAKRAEATARPPRSVRAEAAAIGDFSLSEDYAARLVPSLEVKVTPKVPGRILSVGADMGSSVSVGQVLLRLDPSDYDAQYRQAKGALSSAKASLERTSDSGQDQLLLQAQTAVDQARVAYDNAKSLYDKTKRLFDSGALPKQQLDDVSARFKSAGIQRDAAVKALSLVRTTAGSQSRGIATGQVEQAKAQADLAKSQLNSATVRSPIAGRVSYRGVEAGELVGSSTLAFIVIDDRSVLAEAGLSERAVGRVRAGMQINLNVPALSDSGEGRAFVGKVDTLSPSADPRTMLYAVKIRVPNPEGILKGGMLAKIIIPTETRHDAVTVPEKALFAENGGDYAFVVVQSAPTGSGTASVNGQAPAILATAKLSRLVLGESDGERAVVVSGIAAGDLVITEGQDFLTDGDPILVKE